jgi:hypothetical protein
LIRLIDIESMEGMRRYMLRQLPGSELLYLGPFETMSRTPVYHMDHLVSELFTALAPVLCVV